MSPNFFSSILNPCVFRELVEVAVKQKGSGDVTVLLFEGENGSQVFESINNHVACENEQSWSFFSTRLGRRLEKQEM